jgi:hypothetical protein
MGMGDEIGMAPGVRNMGEDDVLPETVPELRKGQQVEFYRPPKRR